MKTPQIPAMPGMSPLGLKQTKAWENDRIRCLTRDGKLDVLNKTATDEKTVAERQWSKPKLAPKPQKPCDHGIFSDDANQLDLVEMFADPTND